MWRSLSQWIGGIGIIFFTIAILPAFGVGEVKLFAAEATGPMHNKVHPRISVTAKWIGTVYLMLTALCIASLLVCGMNPFDAVNYSFVTTATGGFGTHSAMLHEAFNSPAIEYVLSFFMFISGVNYTLIYYTILRGHIRRFFHDAELRCFIAIFVSVTLVCTASLVYQRVDWSQWSLANGQWSVLELCFRESLFTVLSLQTTTGLATCDYTTWPITLMPPLLFVMFAGACSGSTSGGFKCVRWFIIFRLVRSELQRILHPRAVLPVKMNGQVISPQIIHTLFAFVALFTGSLFLGAFLLALFGVSPGVPREVFDYEDALGLAMSSLSNVGPGMGYYGPAHSWAILSPVAKWTCSALMLIGRLEIFPVLVLFTRSFWKR
jgi:trk system potassium uptake protein TrkH